MPSRVNSVVAVSISLLRGDLSRSILLLWGKYRIVFSANEHSRLGEVFEVLIFSESRVSEEESVCHAILLTEREGSWCAPAITTCNQHSRLARRLNIACNTLRLLLLLTWVVAADECTEIAV